MHYRKLNQYIGWIMFAIATTVYALTVEPTASLWDCGEFIAAAYKLQVPHPPGAPFFLLLGRLFSFLALGNTERVAFWINMISVVSSGATIMLLYWTIVLLCKKLLKVTNGSETRNQTLWLTGSGVVGALAYTFSDSFWFSATEAEVYGLSSFFTAFVFWAMLQWEHITSPTAANRWLILIAYMMGLSIGVHLLNLVTIPALGLIYYFKQYKTATPAGILLTLTTGLGLIGLIMAGIIPGLPSLAGSFEVFFVNSLGLPFGAGLIVFVLLMLSGLMYGLYASLQRQKVPLHTGLLALTFMLIGYASYAMVPIRSAYDPPIDENNPETIISFVSYLKREQYGSRPLLYGPYFTANLIDRQQGAPVYEKGKDKYIIADYRLENIYDPKKSSVFPRAYSTQDNHAQLYRQWMNLRPNEEPGFADNLSFFFRYQLGHMFMRYFMWNFVGRESDVKDAGWLLPWDAAKQVPKALAENKARNNYYMLPLLLGLAGLFFQYRNDMKGFSVVALLFLLTGVALVVYLNSPPIEPRERDYIYVGAYYAFAIWIGFGAMATAQFISRFFKNRFYAGVAALSACLAVPALMAAQAWDDHDRTGRYFAIDIAKNVLASCAPNAILFTGGDNDTFPLWYAQEVEGFRTDVRVIVLSYFNTDWYIDQMKRPAYDSEPLPFSLTAENYKQGGANDYLPYVERPAIKGAISLKQYLKLIKDNSPALQLPGARARYNTVPAKTFYLDVETVSPAEKEKVNASTVRNSPSIPAALQDIIPENMQNLYTDRMFINMKGNALEKKDLMILDLLATNRWERPVYFNPTSLMGTNLDFSAHVVQEGSAYRLLPVNNPDPSDILVNSDTMYHHMMHEFSWRALDNPDIYYSTEDHIYRGVSAYRQNFNTLIGTLLAEGKTEKARKALMKSLEAMPDTAVAYDFNTVEVVKFLWMLKEEEKALSLSRKLHEQAKNTLDYCLKQQNNTSSIEVTRNMVLLQSLANILKQYDPESADVVMQDFMQFYPLLDGR